jgi:hypothetical protein
MSGVPSGRRRLIRNEERHRFAVSQRHHGVVFVHDADIDAPVRDAIFHVGVARRDDHAVC